MNQDNAGAPVPGPMFCLQCHDTHSNMIPLNDNVHAALEAASAGAFPEATKSLLLGIYDNAAINAKLTEAGTTYATAYAEMKLPAQEAVGARSESTNIVNTAYSVSLTAPMAAAELGVSPAVMVAAIARDRSLASSLASLAVIDNGAYVGVVRRDTWEAAYPALRSALFANLPKVAANVVRLRALQTAAN